jgi:hypothetical protein
MTENCRNKLYPLVCGSKDLYLSLGTENRNSKYMKNSSVKYNQTKGISRQWEQRKSRALTHCTFSCYPVMDVRGV